MVEDSAEQIQKCLNCTYSFCSNCVERIDYEEPQPFEWKRKKPPTAAQLEYIDWYYMGYTDYEIAAKLNKGPNTIFARRISLGLPPLPHVNDREARKAWARKLLGGRRR